MPNLDLGVLETIDGLTGRAGLLKNVLADIGDIAETTSIHATEIKHNFHASIIFTFIMLKITLHRLHGMLRL